MLCYGIDTRFWKGKRAWALITSPKNIRLQTRSNSTPRPTTRTDNNPDRLPSYILYEAKNNLMFYIGPDFFHSRPEIKVINTLMLNPRHRRRSHTRWTLGSAMSL